MCSTINPLNVIWIVKQEFDERPIPASPISDHERELAGYFIDILDRSQSAGSTYVDVVYDLVENGNSQPSAVYDPEADDEEYRTDPSIEESGDGVDFNYKSNAVKFWRSGDRRRTKTRYRSFSSVQHKFRLLKHRHDLNRWAKQIDAGGPHKLKLHRVSKLTFDKFNDAKRKKLIVHDLDVRKWALSAAKDQLCNNFKASQTWLYNFKKTHKIVSRKITKFVSKTDVEDREAIENAAIAFQLETSAIIEEQGADNVANADQSGFEYELHSGRTLEIQGEKKVERIVQSKNATTHSFTIMPTMTASGVLQSPLYVVLREPSGQFGPQVKASLFQPPNLKISCSQSGKMGKSHLDEWLTEVYLPNVNQRGVLVIDSWSTFSDQNIRKNVPNGIELTILQIPAGATGLVQPWDVYGFRLWKNFVKHIEDYVLLHDIPVFLSQRNNCLKMQALVHEQLRSPRYVPLFRYSWYKAGLVGTRPDSFQNPVNFAFRQNDVLTCSSCDQEVMATCSWCKGAFCFEHFFVNCHMCGNFIP